MGQFNTPNDIAFDSAGHVVVSDYLNHRIQVFERDGTFLATWGRQGSGLGEFINILGVVVDSNDTIYAMDGYNYRIQVFAAGDSPATPTFAQAWGSYGNAPGQVNEPCGLVVDDHTDTVYVADTKNHRIQQFAADGTLLSVWGSYGSGEGQFNTPWDVDVDSAGNIYVVDSKNYRIQKFVP